MAGLPDGEKNLRIRLLEYMNVTDGQTDKHTPHDSIGRICIASHGTRKVC